MENSKPRIAAVVTLFFPNKDVVDNIRSYLHDVEKLYLFDNSPPASKQRLKGLENEPKTVYVTYGSNVGLGVALNAAATMALKDGFEYLLTMDQDSVAAVGMLPPMQAIAESSRTIAIVTPFHRVHNEWAPSPKSETEEVLTTMTSGSLLKLSAYQDAGAFREDFFIDYIDIEYCLRLRLKRFKVVRANRSILDHRVGDLEERRFLWWHVHPANHSPERLYYQTRNRFYLRALYRKHFPEFFRRDVRMYCNTVIKMLLYERVRFEKLKMIFRGFVAFWRNDFAALADRRPSRKSKVV